MALDLRQMFVSAQYLENKWTEFHQILNITPILGSVHITFCKFLPELWRLIYAKILFPLNILRTNQQNFIKL